MKPGEYFLERDRILANVGRRHRAAWSSSTPATGPVQVGSHYHFFEVNDALDFDREAARGMRLNIRGRHRRPLRAGRRERSPVGGVRGRSSDLRPSRAREHEMSLSIPRRTYADLYGPTNGRPRAAGRYRTDHRSRKRLRGLWRRDHLRRRQSDSRRHGAKLPRHSRADGALDLVITNALIIDHWGIVKGDIGIRDGRIVKVGKAGNPDTMDGVDPELVVGASTEVIAGENLIVTAGGIDSHIHFISPQQIYEALSNGITTMIGGGTGPATGTNATTCTPGAWNLARMLQAAEAWPMNFGFLGKGNAAHAASRWSNKCAPARAA